MRYILIACAVAFADQLSKTAIRSVIDLNHTLFTSGFINIIHVRNTGMAFSMFPGANIVLASLTIAVMAYFVYLIFSTRIPLPAGGRIALSLLLGGAAGNLCDRIFRGAVTDFIDLHAGAAHWPAFNLADSAICIGAALAVYSLLRAPGIPHASSAR